MIGGCNLSEFAMFSTQTPIEGQTFKWVHFSFYYYSHAGRNLLREIKEEMVD